MNAQSMCPNEWPQNERKKEENERTDKITFETTNKPNNRTSEMPAKQMENDQWNKQTPANQATQQMAASKDTYPFWEEEKPMPVWFRI